MSPIPRFLDRGRGDIPVEIVLHCYSCGWAVVSDKVTRGWRKCRLCGAPLKEIRIDYPPSSGGDMIRGEGYEPGDTP